MYGEGFMGLRFRAVVRLLVAALLAVVGQPLRSEATITFTPTGFVEDVIATGLPFATGMAFAPDGRLFITGKAGVVRVWQNGSLLPTPFLDISASVANSNDRGLLGVAVHPNFPTTPYVYLLYTWNPPGFSNTAIGGRVSRLIRVEADPAQGYNVAKPGSDQPQTVVGGPGHVIMLGTNSTAANIGNPTDGRDITKASCMTGLTMAGAPIENCIPSDEDSHSIGTVMFGIDGSLFVGTGDGSNYTSVDPRALRSQNLNSLTGKIMRIDPATGLGLADNPFFDAACPQCNRSKVYSMGLRNPFRFTVHPVTNEPYIGDVGWNTWEEINTGKGANFGWPCYEGGAPAPAPVESGTTTSLVQGSYQTNPGTSAQCAALYAQGLNAVRAPIFSYSHGGTDGTGTSGGASANGGTFYTGTVYPPSTSNAEFILDYNRRWIRYLTFDAQGKATVNNFGKETTDGMVQVLPGPDTNLYVVVLNASGSQVRRIRYLGAGNTPPTAVANATPTIGTAPLDVTFSSLGSFDPDAQPISYSWAFGDGGTSTQANPTHTYLASGVYTATLTVTELTSPFASRTDDVLITVGSQPPLATITAPANGTTYKIGDIITYSGTGSAGGQPLDPSQLTWDIRLHHNEHQHFSALPGGAGGTFQIIEHGDNTFYELCLTATVDQTLTDTQCVNLYPQTTTITLATSPSGLLINYEDEGLTQASPMIIHPVVGSDQTASVALIQGGLTFNGWLDGEPSNSHPFIVGLTPVTYTAHVHQPAAGGRGVGEPYERLRPADGQLHRLGLLRPRVRDAHLRLGLRRRRHVRGGQSVARLQQRRDLPGGAHRHRSAQRRRVAGSDHHGHVRADDYEHDRAGADDDQHDDGGSHDHVDLVDHLDDVARAVGLAAVGDADGVRRRRHPGRIGGEVPLRRGGLHQRDSLLQERAQHRDAHGQPVDHVRDAPGAGDVHGRDRLGLAAGDVLVAGGDRGEHDLHRVVLRASRLLRHLVGLLRDGRGGQSAAASAVRRGRRR